MTRAAGLLRDVAPPSPVADPGWWTPTAGRPPVPPPQPGWARVAACEPRPGELVKVSHDAGHTVLGVHYWFPHALRARTDGLWWHPVA